MLYATRIVQAFEKTQINLSKTCKKAGYDSHQSDNFAFLLCFSSHPKPSPQFLNAYPLMMVTALFLGCILTSGSFTFAFLVHNSLRPMFLFYHGVNGLTIFLKVDIFLNQIFSKLKLLVNVGNRDNLVKKYLRVLSHFSDFSS